MKIKSHKIIITRIIHLLLKELNEAVYETKLGIGKDKNGHYHFVSQDDIEDYAIRSFKVATEKFIDNVNNNKY